MPQVTKLNYEKMLGWLNFVFAGMNFDLELKGTEAADVVCYFCVLCVEIYLMEHFWSWGGWSLYLCVCVWCVRGNSFELEGAEEADEVAAAGGERLPDAAGLQVFQVKVVQVFQVNCPPL